MNKEFIPYISREEIERRCREIADQINRDYSGRNPLFLGILNGAFMFASELFKHVNISCRITFIKLASYQGTKSTGNIISAIGLDTNLTDEDVLIIEDIVDTGNTMNYFIHSLKKMEVNSVKICTLLHKPEALQHDLIIDYTGFEIPDKFVIGFGLDYDGYGRNLDAIYQIKE